MVWLEQEIDSLAVADQREIDSSDLPWFRNPGGSGKSMMTINVTSETLLVK